MIYYDWDSESWRDEEDTNFRVGMTPESQEDCDKEFSSQEEFFIWYND